MPPEKEMYKLVCEKRFDKLEEMHQETIDLLKGKNSAPGVVDNVRSNTKALKRLYGAFIFCGGAVILQVVRGIYGWIEGLLSR